MKKTLFILILAVLVVSGISAEKTRQGTGLDQSIQASLDPLGLQLVTKVYYRLPFVQQEGMLWESTKVEVGIQNNLSPAYDMIGAYIDFAPIAIFDLALSAQAIGYFNGLGFGFYNLGGYSAPFDGDALKALPSKNSTGYVLTAAPTLKFAWGPVVMLDAFSLSYYSVDDGSGFFYERVGNCVIAKNDIELLNQAYLLATVLPGVLAGLNDAVLYVPGSGYVSHRLSAMGVYSTRINETVSLNAVLMLGTYFSDRYYQYALYVAAQAGVTLAL